MRKMHSQWWVWIIAFVLVSCSDRSAVPKPTSYPRIHFPKRAYNIYDSSCPFTFVKPAYAYVVRDSSKAADPCWLNVIYGNLNARLYLSYKDIRTQSDFDKMSEDAHSFAYKHTAKADDITENVYNTANHVSGLLYEIEGNTASSIQFFATDSAHHYLRGALYFESRPNKDSLDPIIKFLRVEIDTMIKSLKWK